MTSLLRMRWAVRAVLVLGVAASISGNILHAHGGWIARVIAAWSPLALLLTVELISRVPVHSRFLGVARMVAAAVIAGIAAWVSYWHMAGVAARYGETGASPYLLPLSVDGLIVVASICLVELGGRISAEPVPAAMATTSEVAVPEPEVADPDPEAATARRRGDAAAKVAAALAEAPGASVAELARLAGVSRSTVRRNRAESAAAG